MWGLLQSLSYVVFKGLPATCVGLTRGIEKSLKTCRPHNLTVFEHIGGEKSSQLPPKPQPHFS